MAIPPQIANMKVDQLRAALRELKKRNERATQKGGKADLQKRLAFLVSDLRLNVTKLRAASAARAPAKGSVPAAADAVLASIRANVNALKKMHGSDSPHVTYLTDAERVIKGLRRRVAKLEDAQRSPRATGAKCKIPHGAHGDSARGPRRVRLAYE